MAQNAASTDAAPKPKQQVVSALGEKDLPEAERILRLAFGTFLGAADPQTFSNDRDYVMERRTRREQNGSAAPQ
jgi:hypothetical protein